MDGFWFTVGMLAFFGFVGTLIASILHAVGTSSFHQSWEAAAIYAFIAIGCALLSVLSFITSNTLIESRRF